MSLVFEGKVIVLLRTSSSARVKVYQHLKDLGATLVMVHPTMYEPFAPVIDHWIYVDTHDINQCEKVLYAELDKLNIVPDAITSFDEYGVYTAAVLAERAGLRPMPLPSADIRLTNIKSEFRKFCTEKGLPSPKSCALHSASEQVAERLAATDVQFPVVVKPSPGAGSLLAKKCLNLAELEEHVAIMWNELDGHRDAKHFAVLGTKIHVLVEEFIGGCEVDIDTVIENGVIRFSSISDNFEPQAPYFSEVGGLTPSVLPPYAQKSLREALEAFVASHGTKLNGVVHFEAKYDFQRQAAFIIEVNMRMGSAETSTLVKNAFRVELGECVARLALGLPLDNLEEDCNTPKQYCASVNIYAPSEGVLIHAAPPPPETKGFVDALVQPTPGTMLALPPKSFACMAWMVARGDSAKEAVDNIQMLTDKFVIHIGAQ